MGEAASPAVGAAPKRAEDLFSLTKEMAEWDISEPLPFTSDVDPIQFWCADGRPKKYPILHTLAMEYLIVQASSVACESLFSHAGLSVSAPLSCMAYFIARAVGGAHLSLYLAAPCGALQVQVLCRARTRGTWALTFSGT